MDNLKLLSIICSIMQIIGLFLIIFSKHLPYQIWYAIGVCGFAALLKLYTLYKINNDADV